MKRLHLFLILVVVLLAFGWFFIWPAVQNISILRQQKITWQERLDEALAVKEKLAELQNKYQSLQQEEERIMEAIPNQEDLPGLLVQLEALASQNGLVLSTLDFSYPPELEKIVSAAAPVAESKEGLLSEDFSSVITSVSAAEQVVPSNVKILSVTMSLLGDYPALKNFLKAVENNLRLSDVTSISFSQQELTSSPGQTFVSGRLTIGLNVYYKK